jgi:hypothetical protein
VLKVAPVPLDGDPPVALQLKVYGLVPPVADALQLTGWLTVPVAGQVSVTVSGSAAIAIDADAVALAPLASVTVTLIE